MRALRALAVSGAIDPIAAVERTERSATASLLAGSSATGSNPRIAVAGPTVRNYTVTLWSPATSDLALAGRDQPLQHDEDEQHGPDEDLGPPRAQRAVERNQGLDQAENHDAQDCSEDVAGAAGEDGATDHDRGDDVEFHSDAVQR